MVLKVGKGGVCSGNTLRLKNSGYVQQYKRNAYITMISDDSADSESFENQEVRFLDSSHLNYSINKKGRWNLPDLIKHELATNLTKSELKVTLMEIHNIRRKNNCVGYFTNKGRIRKVLPKRSKYLNSGSVLNVNNKMKRSNSKRGMQTGRRDPDNDDVAEDKINSTCYEVVYPADTKSSNCFSKPTISKYKSNARSWIPLTNVSSTKSNKSKKKIVEIEDDIVVSENDDEQFQVTTEESDNCHQVSMFHEYIDQAFNHKTPSERHRPRRRQTKQNPSPMRKKIYQGIRIAEESFSDDDDFVHVTNVNTNPFKTTFEPVRVILPVQDVCDEFLEIRFPGKIRHARCFPRTFCIDIKDELTETLKKSKLFKRTIIQKLELESFLVFSFRGNYDELHDVYDVHINMATKQNILKLETVFDMMITDIDDLLNRALMYVESFILPETFNQKDKINMKVKQNVQFKTILSDSNHVEQHSEDIKEYEDFELVPEDVDEFCSICFDSITDNPATALKECGHWFCNNCWKQHLHEASNCRSVIITCPQFKCNGEVDNTTMLSLASVKDVEKMFARQKERLVLSTSTQKWCTHNLCGQVLQRSSDICNIAVCQCGFIACLECDSEGHWPASCEQYSKYRKKLDLFHDDILLLPYPKFDNVPVKGKNCPTCKTFIVKTGGCPYMVCVCGEEFCWSCLTPQRNHRKERSWCYARLQNDGTHQKQIRHISTGINPSTDRSELYLKALESRHVRHRRHVKYLRDVSKNLQSKMTWWASKRQLDVHTIENIFVDLADHIIELNFAAEYCYVMLDCETSKHNSLIPFIKTIAPRLVTIATDICDVLKSCSDEDRQKTLSHLKYLKESGQSTLVSLLNLFSRCKA